MVIDMMVGIADHRLWGAVSEGLNYPVASMYRKFPKYSDTQKICRNHSKIWTMWLYHRVMSPNDADRMANSADPDQTAPLDLHYLLRPNCPKT